MIAQPMDLTTLINDLTAGAIPSPQHFTDLAVTIFQNAIDYNSRHEGESPSFLESDFCFCFMCAASMALCVGWMHTTEKCTNECASDGTALHTHCDRFELCGAPIPALRRTQAVHLLAVSRELAH